jgi:hypothetical protein
MVKQRGGAIGGEQRVEAVSNLGEVGGVVLLEACRRAEHVNDHERGVDVGRLFVQPSGGRELGEVERARPVEHVQPLELVAVGINAEPAR